MKEVIFSFVAKVSEILSSSASYIRDLLNLYVMIGIQASIALMMNSLWNMIKFRAPKK